jgi:hypothetical protein
MRKLLLIFTIMSFTGLKSQMLYDDKIDRLSEEIISKFSGQDTIRIGLGPFLNNDIPTKFTQLISEDLSASLVRLSINERKIIVMSEAKLKTIDGFLFAETETDKSLLLHKAVEYVCFGRLTDIGNEYKLLVKIYDTKEGNLISAFKTTLEKTDAFTRLNAETLEKKSGNQNTTELNQPVIKEEEKPKKEKKKRENSFWKLIGNTVVNTGTQAVNDAIDKKLNKTGQPQPGGTQNNTEQQTGLGSSDSANQNQQTQSSTDCKAYINIVNKTENTISVKIYKENPANSYGMRPIFTFTIAPGKSKKQKIDKDFLYYYYATINASGLSGGGQREFEGTFEVEECNQTVDEEIE